MQWETWIPTITNWIPTITTAGVLACVGFIYRETLGRYLAHAVAGHFADQLAKLNSDLRRTELTWQSDLQARQRQIDALHASVTSSRSGRQTLIDKRRLEATQLVWKAAVRLSFKEVVLRTLENVNIEVVLKSSGAEIRKHKAFFETLDTALGATDFSKQAAESAIREEQPFVSLPVWAYYSAYSAVIMNGVLFISLLNKGLDPKYLKLHSIQDVVKKVLPHQAVGIDDHGITYCYMCSTELLDKLLAAIQDDLEGKVQDAEQLHRAAELLGAVTALNIETAKVKAEVDVARN
jgi:hypothetical protein